MLQVLEKNMVLDSVGLFLLTELVVVCLNLPVEGESITPIISKPIVNESVVEETELPMPIIILPKVWSLVKIHCMSAPPISMTFTVL